MHFLSLCKENHNLSRGKGIHEAYFLYRKKWFLTLLKIEHLTIKGLYLTFKKCHARNVFYMKKISNKILNKLSHFTFIYSSFSFPPCYFHLTIDVCVRWRKEEVFQAGCFWAPIIQTFKYNRRFPWMSKIIEIWEY